MDNKEQVLTPILYQHSDGRYGLSLNGRPGAFTTNDPAWYRVPLDVVEPTASGAGAVPVAWREAIDGLTDFEPAHGAVPCMSRGGDYLLKSDVIAALSSLPAAPAADSAGPARQYFYRQTGCKPGRPECREDSFHPDCVCWHDIGTGPLKGQEATATDWRDKAAPATPDATQSFLDLARLYCAVTETPSGDLQWSFRQRDMENFAAEVVSQRQPAATPDAPGHTDLMVSPESIDSYMEANPLPEAKCGHTHYATPDAQGCSTDVCQTSKRDGVMCADDECDIASGVRKPDAQGDERVEARGRNIYYEGRFEDETDEMHASRKLWAGDLKAALSRQPAQGDEPALRKALEGMLAVFACGAPEGESPTIDFARAALSRQPSATASADAQDAARWRMLPAFFADYQINGLQLLRDIDAALAAAKTGDSDA